MSVRTSAPRQHPAPQQRFLPLLRNLRIDATTMFWRSLRTLSRDPDELILALVLPIAIMLMFVYVFGGAMSVGTDYITYATPGVILLCAGYGASNTALAVANDMNGGIIDRFRSMPMVGATVMFGHVAASLVKNSVSTAVVLLVAMAIGFRPSASPAEWLGAAAIVLAYVLAITCLAALIGVSVRTPAAAGGFGFVMLFLPYVSSAFVPPETMPAWLRGFAEAQPVTPVIESIRALLVGMGTGGSPVHDLASQAATGIAWCTAITLVSLSAAGWVFARKGR
ncbi:ABC transporter permease [Gordonia McavH-238-E]|uniref:ABC transporter permease n=1 Tax=Gordonia sp. McavH-238-E TaxID=2917736 RepID=UPI001EF53F40|nr:ABC transporter permease [Gordonia sp. McavH-238-E]MCG7633809.1 ABC transporter permease [Gordonia sp. McavH-238-E]